MLLVTGFIVMPEIIHLEFYKIYFNPLCTNDLKIITVLILNLVLAVYLKPTTYANQGLKYILKMGMQ